MLIYTPLISRSADYLQNFVDEAQDKVEIVNESYQEEPISPPSSYPQSSPKFDQPATNETYSPRVQYPSTRSPFPSPREYISQVGKGFQRTASHQISNARRVVNRTAQKAIKNTLGKVLAAPVMTSLAAAAPYLAAAGAIIAAFWAFAVTLIITIVVWSIGFILFTAMVLFIINSGAYVVPPGSSLEQGGGVYTGDLPAECPAIWPVTGPVQINQGPNYCGPNGSHCGLQAIDVGVYLQPVYATHAGIIDFYIDSCTGLTITVTSVCNGVEVTSVYAHMLTFNSLAGTLVERGSQIGISGNTGNCTTGAHLHYAFQAGTIPMSFPYIPENQGNNIQNLFVD